MAIRFASFEQYKGFLANKETGKTSPSMIFLGAPRSYISLSCVRQSLTSASEPAAGLGAGVTEAVMVVCPMEVVKIRLQAQVHSMTDPLDIPKYRNAAHALFVILREEGPATLYRGVALTALRQATNQGAWLPRCLHHCVLRSLLMLQVRRLAQPPTLPPTRSSRRCCSSGSRSTPMAASLHGRRRSLALSRVLSGRSPMRRSTRSSASFRVLVVEKAPLHFSSHC